MAGFDEGYCRIGETFVEVGLIWSFDWGWGLDYYFTGIVDDVHVLVPAPAVQSATFANGKTEFGSSFNAYTFLPNLNFLLSFPIFPAQLPKIIPATGPHSPIAFQHDNMGPSAFDIFQTCGYSCEFLEGGRLGWGQAAVVIEAEGVGLAGLG